MVLLAGGVCLPAKLVRSSCAGRMSIELDGMDGRNIWSSWRFAEGSFLKHALLITLMMIMMLVFVY